MRHCLWINCIKSVWLIVLLKKMKRRKGERDEHSPHIQIGLLLWSQCRNYQQKGKQEKEESYWLHLACWIEDQTKRRLSTILTILAVFQPQFFFLFISFNCSSTIMTEEFFSCVPIDVAIIIYSFLPTKGAVLYVSEQCVCVCDKFENWSSKFP